MELLQPPFYIPEDKAQVKDSEGTDGDTGGERAPGVWGQTEPQFSNLTTLVLAKEGGAKNLTIRESLFRKSQGQKKGVAQRQNRRGPQSLGEGKVKVTCLGRKGEGWERCRHAFDRGREWGLPSEGLLRVGLLGSSQGRTSAVYLSCFQVCLFKVTFSTDFLAPGQGVFSQCCWS